MKKVICFLLALSLIFGSLVLANADDLLASGDIGTGIHWEISSDKTLTVSGTGKIPDYKIDAAAPWYGYRSQIAGIVVANGITKIGQYAFYGVEAKQVSLADSVAELGAYCFSKAFIEGITLPSKVTNIPEHCFESCSSLKSCTFAGISSFGAYAFSSSGIEKIEIPEGIKALPNNLFAYCDKLKSIVLPVTLERIEFSTTFKGTEIADVYYNGTLDQWMKIRFDYSPMNGSCNLHMSDAQLTDIKIPENTVEIPSSAFQYVNCDNIYISDDVTKINANAFKGSNVSYVFLPKSIAIVETDAFAGCSGLKRIFYTGSEDDWSKIALNSNYEVLKDVKRSYNLSSFNDVCSVSAGTVTNGAILLSDTKAVAGDSITINAVPDKGYNLKSISVNGEVIEGTKFTITTEPAYIVTAEFEFYKEAGDHGTCGKSAEWLLLGGTELVINGSGEMTGYSNGTSAPWNKYKDSIDKITIGEGITGIGNYDFYGFTKLKKINLPGSVTSVGRYAFYGCTGLEKAVFSAGLTGIGDNAFYGCIALREVDLPDGLESIGSNTFYGCASLQQAVLPESLTSIGNSAYKNCAGLSEICFPAGLTNVGDNAFYACTGLDKIKFSTGTSISAVSIGNSAFYGCMDLKEAVFREGVTSVGNSAFYGCTSLQEAVFPGGLASIGNSAFYGCSDLRTVSFRSGLKSIGNNAFRNCVSLKSAEFPEGLTTLGSEAFYACTSLEKVEFSTGLNRIENYTFENCTGLQEIKFPDGLQSIGDEAFYGCNSLKEIKLPEALTAIGDFAFENCTGLQSAEFPTGLASIGREAFYGCSALKELKLPSALTVIGDLTFENCTGLQSVVFPENLESINRYAFYGCSALQNLELPQSLTSIGSYSFARCTALKEVVFPEKLASIGSYAFSGCKFLSVEFKGNAPAIDAAPFDKNENFSIFFADGKTGWTSPLWKEYYTACVDTPSDYSTLDSGNRNSQNILFALEEKSLTATVGDGSDSANNAGYHGSSRGKIVIPDTVTKEGKTYSVIGINQNAFKNNLHIKEITLGKEIHSVIPTAFIGCPGLSSFEVSGENAYYKTIDGVLYDKTGLYLYVYPGGKTGESFTVPESVDTIGLDAFYNNSYLKKLDVEKNVKTIYSSAFCGLENLEEITLPFIGNENSSSFTAVFGGSGNSSGRLPASLTSVKILGDKLSSSAFLGCSGIKEIELAKTPETIPSGCFSGCTQLEKITFKDKDSSCEQGELNIPEGVVSVAQGAFSGCREIKTVNIPSSVDSIASDAFKNSGLEEYKVAENQKIFSTDDNGVLYNAEKTQLISYPAGRPWPYYNVLDTTTEIMPYAFSDCQKLINLHIPNKETVLNKNAVSSCPNTTICCYKDSKAKNYAVSSGITVWYMDNKPLSGIRLFSLPVNEVQKENEENFKGLYVVGNYQGKELQIDNYSLSYDTSSSGRKTVTVEYQGRTVTFEIVFIRSEDGNLISFECNEDLNGKSVYITLFDESGKMLDVKTAVIDGSKANITVTDDVYDSTASAKLIVLDSNMSPSCEAQIQSLNAQ